MHFLEREKRFKLANKRSDRPNFIHSNWNEDTRIFLSTSHSAQHIRRGKVKSNEGEILVVMLIEDIQKLLNKKYGRHIIGTMSKTNNPKDDPNFSTNSEYRDYFINQTKAYDGILMDFHIMASHREHDIDLGTDNFINVKGDSLLATSLKNSLVANHLDARIDFQFTAWPEFCFAKQAHLNHPTRKAFQIEVNFRNFESNESYINLLHSFVVAIDQIISGLELPVDISHNP